jgi:uncharacterized repeat protein (TIGR02543 family)
VKWNTKADGTGTSYNANATITMPAYNIKLYAIWENVSYTVTYDLNEGSGTVPTESNKNYQSTFNAALSTGLTAPTGKQFVKWNTQANGEGTSYDAGAQVTMPASNLKLYAIWEDAPEPEGMSIYLMVGIALAGIAALAAVGYFVFIRKP